MKQLLLPALVFASCINAKAQTFDYLDANNIKARINSSGLLFNGPSSASSFEVPKGSGKNTIAVGNLIIGGKEFGSGVLHTVNSNNFSPGPLEQGSASPPAISTAWNRVWKISAAEISYHISHYTSPGYTPIADIASWPALGLSGASLAPYYDANGDVTYDPMDGDYPLIKGTQAIFTVFNDAGTAPGAGLRMGLEIQCMAYVMDCPGDSALVNTVWVNYAIINRSTNTYNDTYIGFFVDPDLGGMMDDYLGSDVSRGMFYCYNGDALDSDFPPFEGYGSILPVQGITILGGPYQDADGVNNPVVSNYNVAIDTGGIVYPGLGLNYGTGFIDDEKIGMRSFHLYSTASTPTEMYYVLQGLKPDGTSHYQSISGSVICDYDFASTSDPLYWATRGVVVSPVSEISEGNVPADRRGFASMGPFQLSPGAYNEIDIAFTTAFDYSSAGQRLAALPILQEYTDSIRHYFTSGVTPCGELLFNSVVESKKEIPSLDVYPNPVSHNLNFHTDQDIATGYAIHDVSGKLVMSGKLARTDNSINVSSLEEGLYLLVVPGYASSRFIVQH